MKTIFAVFLLTCVLAAQEKKPWFGISMEVVNDVSAAGKIFKLGILIKDVFADSPAQKAGIRKGDIIVSIEGANLEGLESKDLLPAYSRFITSKKPGDVLKVTLVREDVTLNGKINGKESADDTMLKTPFDFLKKSQDGTKIELSGEKKLVIAQINVTLEPRREAAPFLKQFPPNDKIFPEFASKSSDEEKLARALVKEMGIEDKYEDTLARLRKTHASVDVFRSPVTAYVHTEPFKMRYVADEIFSQLDDCKTDKLADLARRFDGIAERVPNQPLKTDLDAKGHIGQIIDRIAKSREAMKKALAPLADEEIKFIKENFKGLSDFFSENIFVDTDENKDRKENNLKIIRLAAKIDVEEVINAFQILLPLADKNYLTALKKALDVTTMDTKTDIGRVIVSGKEGAWHREPAALFIDVGGNDFYSNNSGSSGDDLVSVLIDLDGDDAYESCVDYRQGTGLLGIGMLIDLSGNDSYVGKRWSQGTGIMGAGALFDFGGKDTYRGHEFVQSVALCGIGLCADLGEGDDYFHANSMSQSLALARGYSFLLNEKGNDSYYCKGKYLTNYGDEGIFDSWSQACALGFRGIASAGIAVLYDASGNDKYEAGNFSTGGGYYYGWGIFKDENGNDNYIGSRYNQGFTAHQACGYFEDSAGDDVYTTRQGVAQGLAWDECVTVFIDKAGKDSYSGGGSFSQGASAHNSICIFIDSGGDDMYTYPAGQAHSSPNDYHGGTSFSLFLDVGSSGDKINSAAKQDTIKFQDEYGFACWTKSDIASLTKKYKDLIEKKK